jgi:hypothetical protein
MSYLQKRMREKAAQRRQDRVKVLEILAGRGGSKNDVTKAPPIVQQLAKAA